MSNKTLLSIGSGREQVYSIREAKRLGYKIVAVDGNADAAGLKIADYSYSFDINDKNKLLNIAESHDICGVVPAPVGRILCLTGFINDQMKLRGISEKAAEYCTDKRLLYNTFHNDISLPKQVAAKPDDLKKIISGFPKPFILKPSYGSGNRGVVTVIKEEDMEAAISYHLQTLQDEELSLVEELIFGKEYGISGYVKEGRYQTILIRGKKVTDLPYRQTTQYFIPADVSNNQAKKIDENIQRTIENLGLNNCLIQADVILDKSNQFYLLEIAGRPSGHHISSLIIPNVLDVNYIQLGIRLIEGERVDEVFPTTNKCAIYSFWDFEQKNVKKLPSSHKFDSFENLISYELNIQEGDYLKKIKSGNDLLNRGYLLVVDEDLQKCWVTLDEIKNLLKLE